MSDRYTTVFGAMIDDEIQAALKSGMPIEHIYVELMQRAREIGNAVAVRHQQVMEESPCAA